MEVNEYVRVGLAKGALMGKFVRFDTLAGVEGFVVNPRQKTDGELRPDTFINASCIETVEFMSEEVYRGEVAEVASSETRSSLLDRFLRD